MGKGIIEISNTLYADNWHELYVFMKDFRPTRIELYNEIWYMQGISEMFEELKEGEEVPQYDVIFTRHRGEAMTYKFKRII